MIDSSPVYTDSVRPIRWRNKKLYLLDQRRLPAENIDIEYNDAPAVAGAIRDMVVRGAPAIGITAAYGVVLSAIYHQDRDLDDWKKHVLDDVHTLSKSRPTAINLFWALDIMSSIINTIEIVSYVELEERAHAILEADISNNRGMGDQGAALIADGSSVLTHCNAGALATGGYGTALGVIRSAWAGGRLENIYADETRPWLQGSRLTAWELLEDKIPVNLICEGAAGSLMSHGKLDWVIVGADRVAANGDVANKIGTYNLAILARHHGVRFMVVAPTSTIDLSISNGADIPIESRDSREILICGDKAIAAPGAKAWNPVFDVTPAELIDVLVTEKGVIENPHTDKIAALFIE